MPETIAKRYCSVNSIVRISSYSGLLSNIAMDNREIRRLNLILLIGDHTQAEMGTKWGIKSSMVSNYVTDERGIGPKIARKIEVAEALPRGWMDVPQTVVDPILNRFLAVYKTLSVTEKESLVDRALVLQANRLPAEKRHRSKASPMQDKPQKGRLQ